MISNGWWYSLFVVEVDEFTQAECLLPFQCYLLIQYEPSPTTPLVSSHLVYLCNESISGECMHKSVSSRVISWTSPVRHDIRMSLSSRCMMTLRSEMLQLILNEAKVVVVETGWESILGIRMGHRMLLLSSTRRPVIKRKESGNSSCAECSLVSMSLCLKLSHQILDRVTFSP